MAGLVKLIADRTPDYLAEEVEETEGAITVYRIQWYRRVPSIAERVSLVERLFPGRKSCDFTKNENKLGFLMELRMPKN